MNFISNALKFTQKNGKVKIELNLKSLKNAKNELTEASDLNEEQRANL